MSSRTRIKFVALCLPECSDQVRMSIAKVAHLSRLRGACAPIVAPIPFAAKCMALCPVVLLDALYPHSEQCLCEIEI
jgi:hypothetical protein